MQLDDADLKTIQKRAAEALRRYLSRPNGDTEDLREVALQLVNGRQHFFNREGEPDWRGVSHAYRQWSRETYNLAGVPKERLSSLQASVRYHVGHVLREVVDADTLADLGLLDQSPRQRSAERHASTYDLASLFGSGGRITDPEQIVAALRGMVMALRRIDVVSASLHGALFPEEFDLRMRQVELGVAQLGIERRLTSRPDFLKSPPLEDVSSFTSPLLKKEAVVELLRGAMSRNSADDKELVALHSLASALNARATGFAVNWLPVDAE